MFNSTRMELDRTMEEFLYDMTVSNELQMPLYYVKLGVYELNCSFLVSSLIITLIV